MATAGNIPPGWLGNLSEDQEAKLRQLWGILLLLNAVSFETEQSTETKIGEAADRLSLKRTETTVSASSVSTFTPQVSQALKNIGMSASEIRSIKEILHNTTVDDLRLCLLNNAKNDNPDALLLRFLRARKFDLVKSFNMILRSMLWRLKTVKVEEKVLLNSELKALQESRDKSNPHEAKEAEAFLAQLRMGKCYQHGCDKQGRPVGVVRVKLHKPSAQSSEVINRFILHVIESTRLLLVPPVDTVTIVFDMTGFTLSNMEYAPVKFIIECFQDNYPESLGTMLIHNAPWVFSGIWKVIKGWMDPVIVSKVHFTYKAKDLCQFIDHDKLPKELGGGEDWTYQYTEPVDGENALMDDTVTRDALQAERLKIGEELLRSTSQWIKAANERNDAEVKAVKAKRDEIIEQLRLNYWKVDPYTRGRHDLDRKNIVQDGGKVEFYPGTTSPDVSSGSEVKVPGIAHVEQTKRNAIPI